MQQTQMRLDHLFVGVESGLMITQLATALKAKIPELQVCYSSSWVGWCMYICIDNINIRCLVWIPQIQFWLLEVSNMVVR